MTNEFIPQPKPEWANYLAQDGDGQWCWWSHEPQIQFDQYFGLLWVFQSFQNYERMNMNCGYGPVPSHPEKMLYRCDEQGNRTLVLQGESSIEISNLENL